MAYITNEDIEARLGAGVLAQLTDDDGNGVADLAVVDAARRAAEGEVESYLARRYRLPIDVAAHTGLAGLLAAVTLDLVEGRLRARRPPVDADAIRLVQDARTWLRRVAAGEIDLPAATPLDTPATQGITAAATGEPRVLTREEFGQL